MSSPSTITIIVRNEQPKDKQFFLFLEPPKIIRDVSDPKIYTNAVGSGYLNAKTGANEDELIFDMEVQYMAGAQLQSEAPEDGVVQTGKISAVRVNLEEGGQRDVMLRLDDDKRPELDDPTVDRTLQKGVFRVSTPAFKPGRRVYHVGTAVKCDGMVRMASFIDAGPREEISIKPIEAFYVATGRKIAGETVQFEGRSIDAHKIEVDGSGGTYLVTNREDGTWKTKYY